MNKFISIGKYNLYIDSIVFIYTTNNEEHVIAMMSIKK